MRNRNLSMPKIETFSTEVPQSSMMILRQGITLIAGFVLSQTDIFGEYSPFGVAFAAGVPSTYMISALLGSALGYSFSNTGFMPLRYIATLIAVAVVAYTFKQFEFSKKSRLLAPANAFFCCFATGLAVAFAQGITFNYFILCVSEALLAGAVAYFFQRSFSIDYSWDQLRTVSSQELACIVVCVSLVLMSLSKYSIGQISPARILTVILILFAARYRREAGGSIVGITAGITMGLAEDMQYIAGGYAAGGLFAGIFSPLGQFGTAAAFVVANGIATIVTKGGYESLYSLYEVAIASVIFIAMPKKVTEKLETLFTQKKTLPNAEAMRRSMLMRLKVASKTMTEVSGSVEAVSETLKKLAPPNISRVYARVQESVCSSCGLNSFCWEHNFNDTMNVFNDISTILRSNELVTAQNIPKHFAARCIKLGALTQGFNKDYNRHIAQIGAQSRVCEMRSVIADQFGSVADMLHDLSVEFDEQKLFDIETAERIEAVLGDLGFREVCVSCTVDTAHHMTVEIQCGEIAGRVDRKKLSSTISSICGRDFDVPNIAIMGNQTLITYCERAIHKVRIGSAQISSSGEELCGDSFECFNDGRGRYIMVLSDGMGTGGRAAVDGAMASGLLSRLVKAGFGFDCSLRVVNSALLVKSGDESLATLDIASIDLFTGRADFYKAGAANSFLLHKGKTFVLEKASLPAGILREVEFARSSAMLSKGDIILLVSDGVLSGDDQWIEDELNTWKNGSIQELAEHIASMAKEHANSRHTDDITVVAGILE